MSLIKKYAPKTLNDIAWPSPKVKRLISNMVVHRKPQHILLYGPYGTGKTTLAQVIADSAPISEALGHADLHEMPGHKIGKDEVIKLGNFINLVRLGDFAIIRIEEFDQVTTAAQQSLKILIDQASMCDAFIVGTTNHIEKIDRGIRDRCACLNIGLPPQNELVDKAKSILGNEGVKPIDNDALSQQMAHITGYRRFFEKLEDIVAEWEESEAA